MKKKTIIEILILYIVLTVVVSFYVLSTKSATAVEESNLELTDNEKISVNTKLNTLKDILLSDNGFTINLNNIVFNQNLMELDNYKNLIVWYSLKDTNSYSCPTNTKIGSITLKAFKNKYSELYGTNFTNDHLGTFTMDDNYIYNTCRVAEDRRIDLFRLKVDKIDYNSLTHLYTLEGYMIASLDKNTDGSYTVADTNVYKAYAQDNLSWDKKYNYAKIIIEYDKDKKINKIELIK